MAVTENFYTGNGSTTSYSFTFQYIDEDDIKVSLDGTLTSAYTLANATTVLFNTAPANGVAIRIYRDTNTDSLKATFFAGSAIRAQDLNEDFLQNNYAVQEIKNNTWDNETQTIHSDEAWVSSDSQIATTAAMDARFQDEVTDTVRSDEAWVENDDTVPTTLAAAAQFDTLVQTGTPSGSGWPVGKTWLQNDDNLTLSVWNGSAWLGIASGGTFTNQPTVVYVDATAGDDNNDGHRISRPKATIKAAINQINADAVNGDGSIVVVAPGVYQEVAPIDIQRRDVSIVGESLRSCIVHPTSATETNSLFRVNSGTYLANLTFTGVQASGTRGDVGSIDPDATFGLPPVQGWNVSFFPNATIVKSPYIQNCTNFSDSEIDNDTLDAHNPAGGSGGDLDSAVTGGGLLIDGSVVADASPLRSMVCDSYTHVGLDGPGILVTNNGYCQATSSYAFFTHYHIKCLNGGQANLAASTTDFGRYSLIADGRSVDPVFTANLTTSANDGDITFTIGAPTADPSWHGNATRPQPNMVVELNGVEYPILSAVANGAGWDVTISRPNPTNRSENLGLNGAVATPATAEFFLRSMIASSGHTMEYVGSGTNYSALPENGGVPVEANQRVELNGGAIWTAITDHNGKFTVGDFFEVDQQLGFVTIPSGSIAFDLASDLTPQLGHDLDVLNRSIFSSTGNVVVDDTLDVNSHKVINVTDPTNAQDAATKNYVDTTTTANPIYVAVAGDAMTGELAMGSNKITGLGTPTANTDAATKLYVDSQFSVADKIEEGNTSAEVVDTGSDGHFKVTTEGTERLRINASGNVGIGTTSPGAQLHLIGSSANNYIRTDNSSGSRLFLGNESSECVIYAQDGSQNGIPLVFKIGTTERARIDSSGRLLVGTSTARDKFFASTFAPAVQIEGSTTSTSAISTCRNSNDDNQSYVILSKSRSSSYGVVSNGDGIGEISFQAADGTNFIQAARITALVDGTPGSNDMPGRLVFSTTADGASSPTERMRITNAGRIFINTTDGASPTVASKSFADFGGASDAYGLYLQSHNSTTAYFNRQADDGTVIDIRQGGVSEGSISVSGTTVQLNGAHLSRWSQLLGGGREEILRGTVLSNLDEMCDWGEEENEQLNRMKISDVEGDPNVAGVFVDWDNDDDTYTDDFYCAMTGDFIIRIAHGVPVHKGQLLMSAGDGTAKPQDDDIVRSKTIAKVTSNHVTCTYDDGSYCVPCVLMAC